MPTLTVLKDNQTYTLEVNNGVNLRRTLLDNNLSPYVILTQVANCGGRGICATCGVWIDSNEPTPTHWHDKLASRFGYPRLSCQITIQTDMTVRILDDKIIWGSRDADRTMSYKQNPNSEQ
ncbi:MAG: 2Fe-2S iron-sulfur cluster-binding protein [Chloroflexota bacterium]